MGGSVSKKNGQNRSYRKHPWRFLKTRKFRLSRFSLSYLFSCLQTRLFQAAKLQFEFSLAKYPRRNFGTELEKGQCVKIRSRQWSNCSLKVFVTSSNRTRVTALNSIPLMRHFLGGFWEKRERQSRVLGHHQSRLKMFCAFYFAQKNSVLTENHFPIDSSKTARRESEKEEEISTWFASRNIHMRNTRFMPIVTYTQGLALNRPGCTAQNPRYFFKNGPKKSDYISSQCATVGEPKKGGLSKKRTWEIEWEEGEARSEIESRLDFPFSVGILFGGSTDRKRRRRTENWEGKTKMRNRFLSMTNSFLNFTLVVRSLLTPRSIEW